MIHHQTGYWIWELETSLIMHCFTIPRAVSVVAGGSYRQGDDGSITFEVSAGFRNSDWPIIQSPFMRDHALTTDFRQTLVLSADSLSYQQTTLVDIYDFQRFEHTDENELRRAWLALSALSLAVLITRYHACRRNFRVTRKYRFKK